MTAPANATPPEPDGEGGADVHFDTGSGDLAYTAFGQDFVVKNFSGRDMHGKTLLVVRQPRHALGPATWQELARSKSATLPRREIAQAGTTP